MAKSNHVISIEVTSTVLGEEFIIAKVKEFVTTTLQEEWTHYVVKKMIITVDKDTFIKINGTDLVKVKAGTTEFKYSDPDIESVTAESTGSNVHAIVFF